MSQRDWLCRLRCHRSPGSMASRYGPRTRSGRWIAWPTGWRMGGRCRHRHSDPDYECCPDCVKVAGTVWARMKFSSEQADVLGSILRWRRDVRHFSTEPVDEVAIERLRAAMDMAPSVGNSRPWRILRVNDPTRRAKVQSIFEDCNREAAAEYDESTRSDYVSLKLAGLRDAPLHLAVFTETEPVEGRGLGQRTMPETLQFSTVMAIHTLWLVARAENIGVGWVSILDPEKLHSVFDAPQSWLFTAYLCVGYAAFDDDRPLLHRAKWQHDTSTCWNAC